MAAEMQQFVQALVQTQQQHQQQTAALLESMEQRMQQSQVQFTEVLGRIGDRGRGNSLVESRGVGKPESLNNKIAGDPTAFKTWRVKFGNWICAAMPQAFGVLERQEQENSQEVTAELFGRLAGMHEGLE